MLLDYPCAHGCLLTTRRQLPQYGTHHGKMVLLKFVTGVRVVILTANFIDQDVNGKSQGVWYQEFPLRPSETCEFEVRLTGRRFYFVVCPKPYFEMVE